MAQTTVNCAMGMLSATLEMQVATLLMCSLHARQARWLFSQGGNQPGEKDSRPLLSSSVPVRMVTLWAGCRSLLAGADCWIGMGVRKARWADGRCCSTRACWVAKAFWQLREKGAGLHDDLLE